MKHISYLAAALLLVSFAHAVQIQAVYYNAYNESGSEFVILYNPSNTTVDLTDWALATPTSEQDAVLQGEIHAQSAYIIADAGWSEKKDDPTWPQANHEEALTLPNTAGFVQLINTDETILDTIGYGETERFDNQAHPGVEEGEILVRINNTHNNAHDFIVGNPFVQQSEEIIDAITNITLTVANSAPRITMIAIEDDSEQEGIQLIPIPGSNRSIQINVSIEDLNGLANVRLFIDDNEIDVKNSTVSTYVDIHTLTTEICVIVEDETVVDVDCVPIEILPVAGITTTSHIEALVQPGEPHNSTVRITNTGTTHVDLHIKGVRPALGSTVLGEMTYTLYGTQYELTDTFRVHHTQLAPGTEAQLTLHTQPGYVPAGTYTGQLIIASVPG